LHSSTTSTVSFSPFLLLQTVITPSFLYLLHGLGNQLPDFVIIVCREIDATCSIFAVVITKLTCFVFSTRQQTASTAFVDTAFSNPLDSHRQQTFFKNLQLRLA